MLDKTNAIFKMEFAASELLSKVRDGVPVSVFGLSFGERTHITSKVGFFVYVTTDYVSARLAVKQLNQLVGGGVYHLPERAEVLSYMQAQDTAIASERAIALTALTNGAARGLVTTGSALLQLMPLASHWVGNTISIVKGEELRTADLAERLGMAGYVRRPMSESRGQWSMRGDILDIYPIGSERPLRVELFGDFVETIRDLDPETMQSLQETDQLIVPPATEALMSDEEAKAAVQAIQKSLTTRLAGDSLTKQNRIVGEVVGKLTGGVRDMSLTYAFPFFPHTLLSDYLPKDAVIVYDETKAVLDQVLQHEKEHINRYQTMLMSGDVLKRSLEQLLPFSKFRDFYGTFRQLSFARITSSNFFFEPQALYKFNVAPVTRYSMDFAELTQDIKVWLQRGYRIVICCRDADGMAAVANELNERELYPSEARTSIWKEGASVALLDCELERGFTYHDERAIVIGSGDLFPPPRRQVAKGHDRSIFVRPAAGDYVVHSVHGIGRCLGTKRLTTSLGSKDYIEIEYRGGDKLFVPVDQMDLVSKFGGEAPKLSKMGGKEFAKVKESVKAGVKKMAVDLVALYGVRKAKQGHCYAVDESIMREFVARFPHESTQDQLRAFDEIAEDLRAGKIMERLLVGDVGYGKTEVALRAAFAVMIEGKQAAILAPTTILTEQHFRTAKARFESFGIRVGVLDRFVDAASRGKTLQALERGELDFVCGTHRMLSKDVRFHDLGLLILDEEQRFGVADKEKLKTLQNTMNVLTMTATPIPRTLHMSLSGIRDISTLSNPPAERLPVQTLVTEYSHGLTADCIRREMSRGGQTFVVFNRVEQIFSFAHRLQTFVPEARIIVCHGQMAEAELENNIKRFYDGEADVLVATTIIENGIDLPAVNTIVVTDADRLGLSQLYQLRGRVGRSNRLAYAYFTYTAGKLLTETASKRLTALMEFTEFGSGFKIAMRDLEIRGAGNVLGREQHGHMEKVGYDMYCKLLGEAVRVAKGQRAVTEQTCEVSMEVDAYLPDTYIADDEGRMNVYTRIASIRTKADRDRLIAELKDIYGAPPTCVINLVTIGLYKGYGIRLGLREIKVGETSATLTLNGMTQWAAEMLALNEYGCILVSGKYPEICFTRGQTSVFERVFRFLVKAITLKKSL